MKTITFKVTIRMEDINIELLVIVKSYYLLNFGGLWEKILFFLLA